MTGHLYVSLDMRVIQWQYHKINHNRLSFGRYPVYIGLGQVCLTDDFAKMSCKPAHSGAMNTENVYCQSCG